MEVKLSCKVTLDKFVQSENVESSIDFTFAGISIELRFEQLKNT